ncbi:hypothetical protein [Streptomyces sp. CHB9.2]|uniref:hypothetical protein n=1 Tax=Streptomyces sp. CHB9.2 TaxID=2841670 RepID=UPI002095DAC5|nr:hypothetical protein [Streptomyces sp. CHB9.2]MCO6704822.1 hypothetical protein [Streptomyces sp. CHB9.2]
MSHEVKDNVHLIHGLIDTQTCADPICIYVDKDSLVDMLEDIVHNVVTVRYWISSTPLKTVEEADERTLEQVMGYLDAEIDHRYSDITGYLWTDEHFKVGGHDLIPIFEEAEGKYLLLEITVHEKSD